MITPFVWPWGLIAGDGGSDSPPMLINQDVVEGQTVVLPSTTDEIFLNLRSATSLTQITVSMPENPEPRVGQRVFISSTNHIEQFSVTSADQIYGASTMYSPGDNFVWVQNDTEIWSRVKS